MFILTAFGKLTFFIKQCYLIPCMSGEYFDDLKGDALRGILEYLASREPAVMEIALNYVHASKGSYRRQGSCALPFFCRPRNLPSSP